jgi:hypothetical protein
MPARQALASAKTRRGAQEALDAGREDLLRDAIARDDGRERRAARVHTRRLPLQARAHVQALACRPAPGRAPAAVTESDKPGPLANTSWRLRLSAT